jgi:tetratricopeptide (TPR) repeat protein
VNRRHTGVERLRAAARIAAAAWCLFPAALAAAAAEPAATGAADLFSRGNAAFDEARAHAAERPADGEGISRRYRSAAELFIAAWKAGAASTEVFTNAANAYHFAGARGEAVLFYRRALAVDPTNRRAREALEHIRSGLPIRREVGDAGASIARSLFFWHDGLGFRMRRAAFFAVYALAFAAFAVSLWRRRPFRTLGVLLLVAGLALLGSLLTDAAGGSLRDDAVVLVEVEGREGDGPMYSRSHSKPFPPGTEVRILEARRPAAGGEPWLHVRLLDGSESFVPAGTVGKVIE